MAKVSAASESRRASVNPTSSITPITNPAARDFRASSRAQSTSPRRATSTSSRRAGSRPSSARPGAYIRPRSPAMAEVQHHTSRGRDGRKLEGDLSGASAWTGTSGSWRPARRRTARRRANPVAMASEAAAPPARPASGFTSCNPETSRPPGRRASRSGQPKVHDREASYLLPVGGANTGG